MLGHEKNMLNEKELEGVSGGKSASARGKNSASARGKNSGNNGVTPTETHYCTTCGKTTVHVVYSGGRSICSGCGSQFMG